jgi:Flp pilus assembly protein TadG
MRRCNPTHTITRRLAAKARQERGQVLVEFAVVLPVLILIILGIIYFGRYMNYNNQETQLAEQGARLAAVDYTPSSGTLQNYIQAQAQPELQAGSSDVTKAAAVWIYLPTTSTGYAVGQSIRVCVIATVTYPSPIGTPASTMAQTATMRIEQIPSGWTSTTTTPFDAGNPTGTRSSKCLSS